MKKKRNCRLSLREVTPKRYDLDVRVISREDVDKGATYITLEGQGVHFNTENESMTLREVVALVLTGQIPFFGPPGSEYLSHISADYPADDVFVEASREGTIVEDHGVVFYGDEPQDKWQPL